MSKQKPTRDSKFLQRATALQKRIKAITGVGFDVSTLIRESRQRRISEVVKYLRLRGG